MGKMYNIETLAKGISRKGRAQQCAKPISETCVNPIITKSYVVERLRICLGQWGSINMNPCRDPGWEWVDCTICLWGVPPDMKLRERL